MNSKLPQSEAHCNTSSRESGQPVERSGSVTKKQPKKLKARHLSDLTKRIIVDRYSALGDFDEVAVAMGISGLTGKTVQNVITLALLPSRRPPHRELALPVAAWRTA